MRRQHRPPAAEACASRTSTPPLPLHAVAAALMTGCYPQRVGCRTCSGRRRASAGRRRDDHCTNAQSRWATRRLLRQVAPRSPSTVPADRMVDEYFACPTLTTCGPGTQNPTGYPICRWSRRTGCRLRSRPDATDDLYTERAVRFIEKSKTAFFLYCALDDPRPAARLGQVQGQVQRGLFGDVVMEIDWSRRPDRLDAEPPRARQGHNGLFCSDNGRG